MRDDRAYLSVYLVTDRDLALGRPLLEVVRAAVAGGVTAVQVREKNLPGRDFLAEVRGLSALLAGTGVPLIVNDRVDVAIAGHADGVHVGQEDLPAADVRRQLGADPILGVSVATAAEALAALAAGADYVSVSPVFLTPTKPDAERAVGLAGVTVIRRAIGDAPLLAIGGISSANARGVVLAGADGVSVVSAIMSALDPEVAARALAAEVASALAARRGER